MSITTDSRDAGGGFSVGGRPVARSHEATTTGDYLQNYWLKGGDDSTADDEKVVLAPELREIDFVDPLDSISCNREHTKMVAAGCRGVLKILSLSPNGMRETLDLRGVRTRKLNLLYSPSHAAWSQLNDNLIATTSTNGAVVLWDVANSKIDHHYKHHTRSATVVSFHRNDENLLVSGSKDATVYMYDTRQQQPVAKFSGGADDPIRDVAFCRHQDQYHTFVSADDSGTVRFWDVRSPEKAMISFPAHQGYASSIALNDSPSSRHTIATGGGRDKFIKIWDWSRPVSEGPLYVVETSAGLGKVCWRPEHPFQIASCAVVNDMCVHVWDVRRPFLPMKTFDAHHDSVTDIIFDPHNSHRVLSCGKDGRLFQYEWTDGLEPARFANNVAVDVAADGLVVAAVNSEIRTHLEAERRREEHMRPDDDGRESNDTHYEGYNTKMQHPTSLFSLRSTSSSCARGYDPFRRPIPSRMAAGVPQAAEQLIPDAFYHMAHQYRIHGASMHDLCSHNARVAEEAGHAAAAQTWRLADALAQQMGVPGRKELQRRVAFAKQSVEDQRQYTRFVKEAERESRERTEATGDEANRWWQYWKHVVHFDAPNSCSACLPSRADQPCATRLYHLQSATADFYFGDGELTGVEQPRKRTGFNAPLSFVDFQPLKAEAFELRTEMAGRRMERADAERRGGLCAEGQVLLGTPPSSLCLSPPKGGAMETAAAAAALEADEPSQKLAMVLRYHEAQGDVQTCACVSLVLGKEMEEAVGEKSVYSWLYTYLDMLNRLELHAANVMVRKYAWLKPIYGLTLQGTYIRLSCLVCGNVCVRGWCEKCLRSRLPECALCSHAVQGAVWSCSDCKHGGHPQHMADWFKEFPQCPIASCSCVCGGGVRQSAAEAAAEAQLDRKKRALEQDAAMSMSARDQILPVEPPAMPACVGMGGRRGSAARKEEKRRSEPRQQTRTLEKHLDCYHLPEGFNRPPPVWSDEALSGCEYSAGPDLISADRDSVFIFREWI